MKPELSICIPTYNRAALLKASLEAVLSQCEGRPVEVCVSNNASTDGTKELLESFSSTFPVLRHETRDSNIGLEKNMLAAMRMARGHYTLPIGDDERVAEGGIDRILAALQTKPDMLILDAWHLGVEGKPRTSRLAPGLRGRTITNLVEAFSLVWDKMQPGGFAIRSGCAEPVYAERYLGTDHAYSGAVWDYLLERLHLTGSTAVHCIGDPVIEFHPAEKTWSSRAAAIQFEEIPRWFDLIPPYYAAAVEESRQTYKRNMGKLGCLLHFRAVGQISVRDVPKHLYSYGISTRAMAYIVAVLPPTLAERFGRRLLKVKSIVKRHFAAVESV